MGNRKWIPSQIWIFPTFWETGGRNQSMHGVEYARWRTVNHYLREFGFSQDVAKQAGIHARLLCLWASSQGQDPVAIDTISKLNKNISIAAVSTRR